MKAVIYCRVSTEEEAQVNALKDQVQEAIAVVRKQKWKLADQYIDEGKSGTTTNKRNEYNRLVSDLEELEDKFDVIVVKSQDRLMRNTKEWYLFVDKLVQAQKKLFFYLDNKFYTPDDALITGIKAILAEEFSRDLSKKINNAHKHRQEKGTNVSITSNTWGYDKINKKVVINEEEAEIVRLIYNLCCEGYGSRIIAKQLEGRGIKSRSGGKFQETTIRRIIRNPLFKGTAVMNKHHLDFNTKKTVHMKESEWIYHENIIPAIVSEEIWQKANEMMDNRAVQEKTEAFVKKQRGRNIGKHFLSSKIICGDCGSVYWLRFRKKANGEQILEWSCSEYVQRGRKTASTRSVATDRVGGCDNIHMKDNDLQEVLFKIGQKIFSQEGLDQMQKALVAVIQKAISSGDDWNAEVLKRNQANIMKKRELLLDKMLDGILSDELFQSKDKGLKQEYDEITEKISNIEQVKKEKEFSQKRIAEIASEIRDINDKALIVSKINDHITKITIFHDYGLVSLDFWEDVKFYIKKINYRKVEITL
ncbi:recombinase family protein [Anaeromicropila populeti]|uniref:Site-specific DNA recombinase n=1 Tax=Anaeromicropila populeti TaxID=37658 RepID=A0A1I6JGY1_9FIRM|nr:recombinase family protein [Anaeromicropila populeti]SFR78243.1 Site-specific DNA recombinase [Anaeromicropila populeti]